MSSDRAQGYKDLVYIHWNKEATKQNLKIEEFKELLESLDKSKTFQGYKTKLEDWCRIGDGAWKCDRKDPYLNLYLFKDNKFKIYSTNIYDDNKNLNQFAEKGMHLTGVVGDDGVSKGKNAIKLVKEKFEELTGTTMLKAFGSTDEKYKITVPKQFYYNIVKDNINRYRVCDGRTNLGTFIFNHASSVDFSSMFPSNACGLLPDFHTAKIIEGVVKPNEEYKFAFYLESGHLAIYNEFDTHDWLSSGFDKSLFRFNKTKSTDVLQYPYEKETYTVLMKESKYQLTDVYEYFYNIKQSYSKDSNEYKDAKLVLNASIGKFHTVDYKTNKYAHLAAVIIARSNNKMLKIVDVIPKNKIIQICVDGLIYNDKCVIGKLNNIHLGELEQEYVDCRIAYKQNNTYIVEKNNQIVKYKHGGFNKFKDGRDIDGNVKCLDDIDQWVKITAPTEVLEYIKEL